jgi:lysophospholipase L1-like esterase
VTAALSPLAFFLLVELGLRIWLFSPLIGRHPCSPGWNHPQYLFLHTNDGAGYRLRPFFEGTEINPFGDFKVPVLINSLGMREEVLETTVCGDCYRILLLGDSFTFGEGVRWEETFAVRLEQALNQGPAKSQVFNAGVPAYSLRQSLARLPSSFTLVQPRLVIITWVPILLSREYDNSEMLYLNGYLVQPAQAPQIHVVGDNLFLSPYPPQTRRARWDVWMQSHSLAFFYVKNTLRLQILHYLSSGPLKRPGSPQIPPSYLLKPLDIVARMNQFCRDRNAELLFVLIGSNPDLTRQIEELCREKNIRLLSLAERLYEKDSPHKAFLFQNDDHLNAAGHAYVAGELRPVVEAIRRQSSSLP